MCYTSLSWNFDWKLMYGIMFVIQGDLQGQKVYLIFF